MYIYTYHYTYHMLCKFTYLQSGGSKSQLIWINLSLCATIAEVHAIHIDKLKNLSHLPLGEKKGLNDILLSNALGPGAFLGFFLGGVSENGGFSPQIIHFNRDFHYFHRPFWGVSLFLETPNMDYLGPAISRKMLGFHEGFLKTDSRESYKWTRVLATPQKMIIIYQLMNCHHHWIIQHCFGAFEVSLLNCFGFLPQDFNDSSISQARNAKLWGSSCRLINVESAICQLTPLNPPIHPTKKRPVGIGASSFSAAKDAAATRRK